MYKVKKDFVDHLKGNFKYKAGDSYEEQSPMWTKFLVEKGNIEKVNFEKEKFHFEKKKNENVQKEQN
jgi:hypothetical protein